MAATNIQIISDALLDLGVINESETPSAEQGAHALRKLNELMEYWEENGVRIGWCEQTDTSADSPLYPYAIRGVTAALALELAPSYGGAASVTPALDRKYMEGVALINRKAALKNIQSRENAMQAAEGGRAGYNILTDS